MKTKEQIKHGAMRYVRQDLVPLMGTGNGILLEAFAPAVIDANLKKYLEKEWLNSTELVSDGSVDVEAAYRLLKNAASGKWPIEMFGFSFRESDLDKLYQYIVEA